MFRYSVCGLVWEANRSIPGLSPASAADLSPSVHVSLQAMPDRLAQLANDAGHIFKSVSLGSNRRPMLQVWTLDGGNFFRLQHAEGLVCIVDRAGDRLWMTWSENTSADPYEFLLELVLAFVLRLRDTLCVHASVVVIASRAVVLAGWPGVGKSTLATALGRRGHPILTDDVAAVTVRDGRFAVHPGPAQIQVRREAIPVINRTGRRVSWTPANDRIAAIDRWQPGFAQPRAPFDIRALCFLDVYDESRMPQLVPISPADALIRLVRDTWATRLQNRQMRASEFDGLANLALATRSWSLQFSHADGALEAMCDLIEGGAQDWAEGRAWS